MDAFYNKKHAELARRLKLLVDMYDRAKQSPESMDRDEVEDLMGALLELRGQLRKLQWYGEMNRRGFVKITKKLDKKVPDSNNQHRYLRTKVDPKAFTTNRGVIEYLRTVNDWLSKIGEIKTFDDSGSAASSSSRRHPLTRALRNTSPEQLQKIDDAINSDDATSLAENVKFLEKNDDSLDSSLPALLLNFLQRSISLSSRGCILVLLSKVQTLDEDDDINSRNCIHRLVISIGRGSSNAVGNASEFLNGNSTMSQNFIVPATSPMLAPRPCNALEEELALKLNEDNSSVRLLEFLLENLQGNQRSALKARDTYGRTPLHYAAQHGLAVICQIIMVFMRRWKQMDYGNGWVAKEWQDQEGYTPLHLSVIGLHALTTKALLDRVHTYDSENGEHIVEKFDPSYGGVLALATKANSVSIVRMLVHASIEVNYQDDQGETPLHIAARHGYVECAKVLIEEPSGQAVHLDVSERIFGWTPLFIACVDGHLPMVELLIKAGADATRPDGSGWTAKEHAALRGFINIAEYLHKLNPHPSAEPSSASKETSSPRQGPSLEERRSNGMGKDVNAARPEPVKTFGHKYLTKETMILVTLGTLDTRKIIPAVSFDNISLADAHATQLDTALSIVVSATGATGDPTVIDLPIEESISTDPITFMTMDASKVKLLFDIIPTYAGQKEKVVGRGVALLSSVKPNIGSKRITLQGDVSVPIVAATNLEVIGSVNFNFLLITPFSHPNIAITAERTYWKSVASTMIIGHRGMGKNRTSHRSLQLGENTIESFISAASLGAQYVEFDVQLTKDHVPVIYHDFLVSETGIDAPVHTLTLEQFLHVNNLKSAHPSRQTSPEDLRRRAKDPPNSSSNRPRSYSVGMTDDKHSSDMNERMKHTRDFKLKGFKSNTRGHFIQQPFATLEELFQKLPENLGFNIEMSEWLRTSHTTFLDTDRSRIPHAPRVRGARDGCLRRGAQLLRRHRPGKGI